MFIARPARGVVGRHGEQGHAPGSRGACAWAFIMVEQKNSRFGGALEPWSLEGDMSPRLALGSGHWALDAGRTIEAGHECTDVSDACECRLNTSASSTTMRTVPSGASGGRSVWQIWRE